MATHEVVRFTVLTRGRSGSSAIVDDLAQHPNVACHTELFRHATYPDDRVPIYAQFLATTGKTLSPGAYLDAIAALSLTDSTRAFGFKLLIGQMEREPDLWNMLNRNSFRIIYLIRDPVRAALSGALARARQIWSIRRNAGQPEEASLPPIAIDPEKVVKDSRYGKLWRERMTKRLNESSLTHITVSYEDYLADRTRFMNRLYDFLDVPTFALVKPNGYLRLTSTNVWDHITNAAEVREALQAANAELPTG